MIDNPNTIFKMDWQYKSKIQIRLWFANQILIPKLDYNPSIQSRNALIVSIPLALWSRDIRQAISFNFINSSDAFLSL